MPPTLDTTKSNDQIKGYFGILATLALLTVLVLLIFPAIKHITKVNKEISDARIVKDALEDKLAALQQAKENLDEIESDLPLLDLALPIGSDLPPYLQKLEVLAQNHKLNIVSVQFSNVPLSKPDIQEILKSKKMDYSLTLSGDFVDFKNFLASLESYIRISEINSISIKKENDLRHTIEANSYFLGVELAKKSTSQKSEEPITTND